MGRWNPVDADVYNGPTVLMATDLDLSGIVGAHVALCLLGVTSSYNGARFGLRPKDSPLGQVHCDSSSHGMGYGRNGVSPNYRLLACLTKANGILQHCQDWGGGTAVIRLLGYNILSHPGPDLLDADYIFHETAWLSYDLSAKIGANKAFSVLSYYYPGFPTGAVENLGMRTPGDARTTEYTYDATTGGANRGCIAASGVCGLFGGVIADVNGHIEHAQPSAVPLHVQLRHEGSEVADYVDVQQEIQNTVLNEGIWQNLDVGAHVPCRSLCFLLVEDGGVGTQQPIIAVRRKGEVLDFKAESTATFGPGVHSCRPETGRAGQLMIECSPLGLIDVYAYLSGTPLTSNTKFTLLGYIRGSAPPVISDPIPIAGSDINEPTTNLSFVTSDVDGDVVEATIDLDLTDPFAATVNAIINGVFQAGYAGTITANASGGFDVVLSTHPPFVLGSWSATAYCEDAGGWSDTLVWGFDSVHRYRGLSSGGSGLGLGGIYPISGGMRAAGYLWREEFIANHFVSRNRGTLVGAPAVDRGVTLDGATQYVSYNGQPPPCQIFVWPRQTWEIIFTPDFEADDGAEHVFFDADQAGTSLFSLRKQANNSLLARLGAVDFEIALGTYQASWVVGARSTLIVSAESGDTSVWLNGAELLINDGASWDHRGVDGFFIGVDNGLASGFFDGTIHAIRQVAALIEDAEGLL